MFRIQIAGIPIGIDNRFAYVRGLCSQYLTQEEPCFTVRASAEELAREADTDLILRQDLVHDALLLWGYYESLCLYRAICLRLLAYDAFLMHSAAIALDGMGYVFCAPSGTGKTTHIRLWQEQFGSRVQVINGDKPILRFQGGTLYACGTPWNGKEHLGSNIQCPVAGICFLEQSSRNRIRPLTGTEVSRRIFRQLLIPRDQAGADQLWNLLNRLLDTTPFYLLQCNMDPQAALLAYHTMRRNQDAQDQTGISAAEAGR